MFGATFFGGQFMIKRAKIHSGYPSQLPALRDREFIFSEGINFLYGPNGCGKSSLLRTIAAYSFIEKSHGGWSRLPEYTHLTGTKYPDVLSKWAPDEAKADVEWDGTPSFLLDAQLIANPMTHFEYNTNSSVDGLTNVGVQLALMKSSQGQMTILKLGKALETLLAPPPDIIKTLAPEYLKNSIRNDIQSRITYLEGLPRNGKPTLFLDEPDRSLSLPCQRNLFHEIIPDLAQKFQIICATHSPMCFHVPEGIYHDIKEGYIEKSQSIMRSMFGDYTMPPMLVLGRDWKEKLGKILNE